ncbi:MAG: T9SS type A sorting domain-containing protein [Chitinophagaceae bacterium]|nr:T9SS type A sorting domain-containing protein [Chitinophagaceae bacterium]
MRSFFILFLVCITNQLFAQSYTGKSWEIGVFGYSIDCSQANEIHDTLLSNSDFIRGVSNICDSLGNMLYMSDGMNVYNKYGILLDGGDSLASPDYYTFSTGNSIYPQTSIFLPMDSGKIYFITPTCNDTNLANIWQYGVGSKGPFNVLLYSVIDRYANGGAGKVVKRMQPILENVELNKPQMMACKHRNGKDWWLLKMAADSNNLYTFLVTQDSIYFKGLQRMPYQNTTYGDVWGQMIFSRDGTKWAATCSSNMGKLFTADFNRCNGELSNYQQIQVPELMTPDGPDNGTAGVAYSPNKRFIYVSKYAHVLQYDTQDSTWFTVGDWNSDTVWAYFNGFQNLGLADNNKIYVGTFHGFRKALNTINNPDGKGVLCNYCPVCLKAQSTEGVLKNIPCMPNYELGAIADTCFPLAVSPIPDDVQKFSVYPNPSHSMLYFENGKQASKYLYTIQGVFVAQTKQQQLDISHLPKGIYLVRCGAEVLKVVVE